MINPIRDPIEPRSKMAANIQMPISRKDRIMERKKMERRTVLKGGAAAIGMLGGASTTVVTGVEQASADAAQPPLPDQILAAIQRFRKIRSFA